MTERAQHRLADRWRSYFFSWPFLSCSGAGRSAADHHTTSGSVSAVSSGFATTNASW
ncbi:hypothetical protein ACWKT5_23690 [Streptomyces avermitilis]